MSNWTKLLGLKAALARDEKACVESPAVWLPLSLLFLAPFVDPARPARILHLDLLVLLCFGGYPLLAGGSPVLAYTALAYVLVRLTPRSR